MKTISDLLCMTLKIGEICISIESSPPNLMEPSLQVILVYLYKSCLILMKSGKYLNTYRQLWLTWIYMLFLWISHDFHRKRKSHDNNTSHFSLCDAGNHTFICQYCKYKHSTLWWSLYLHGLSSARQYVFLPSKEIRVIVGPWYDEIWWWNL